MLVYSGDVDGIVPVVGTRRWVASLRLKVRYGDSCIAAPYGVTRHYMKYTGLT